MIGHYLLTLSEEQESRVLTTAMRPGSYGSPCLIGAALAWSCFTTTIGTHGGNTNESQRTWFNERLYVRWGLRHVGERFDALCARFGVERITRAIRNRILSNRARRALSGVHTPEHETVRILIGGTQ